jgi:TolA-binding protein
VTYADAIAAARRQGSAVLPGPDFMELSAALDARRRRRSNRRGMLVALAAVVVVAVGLAALLQREQTGFLAPSPAEPMQAVFDDVARKTPEVAIERELPRLRKPRLRAPAPPVEIVADEPDDPRTHADALYRRAEQHMARGEDSQARRLLQQLTRKHPRYPQWGQAMIDWARLQERRGQGQQAACLYRRYLRRHPTGALASDARASIDRLAQSPAIDVAKCR